MAEVDASVEGIRTALAEDLGCLRRAAAAGAYYGNGYCNQGCYYDTSGKYICPQSNPYYSGY